MTEGERVKLLRKELLRMTGDEFCRPLGVQRTAISRIENGSNGLTDQMVKAICREYGVSEDWLRTGSGEPFVPQTKNQYIADWVNRVMADRDESFRKRFIYALSNMSDAGWDQLEQFLENLKKEE